ncbi:chorismate lyase [Methylobacter tundripaludum]|uniref:Probable chorismate pyruvate-lyase n=1 Tax=Methylobacter tundripaludum TaxID=173365 RepID=A0A2S6H7Q7_9GAMM|nr:chorismate lyase [Methylobacter tundripaludum]PPK73507.1 chorismate lyase [Methylobacter tundripaludum]
MSSKSFLFNREPLWLENRSGTRHILPENVQSWTYEPGSLTQRMRDYYGGAVGVKVLLQQWNTPFLSERRLLKLHENRYSLIREVLLHADGKPLILARTIIPANTVKIAKSNLSHLGNRPLGEVIFSYPKLERIEMDVTLINPPTWTQPAIAEGHIDQPIWGRRTVYAIAHRQMLVSEFFLPGVLEVC